MASPTAAYTFAFNGWLFGGPGQGVQVLQVEGLEDLPALRTQDANRGYLDGMVTGRDFLNGRSIVMTLQVMSDSNAPMQTYLQQLKTYLVSQQTGLGTLQMYLPNRGVQRIYGRVRRRNIKIDPEYTYGRATAVVEFFCPDPRVYNDVVNTKSLVANVGLYRTYNKTFNRTYANLSPGSASTITLTNVGSYETGQTFTVTGACTGPMVTNVGTGQVLSFPALVMGATDVLKFDTDLRYVTLNGAPTRNLLSNSSQWWMMQPASSQTLMLTSAAGTPTATVSWYDAFI